jgi:hypothetical protein
MNQIENDSYLMKDKMNNKIGFCYVKEDESPFHLLFPNLSNEANILFLDLCNEALIKDYPILSLPVMINEHHVNFIRDFDTLLKALKEEALIENFTEPKLYSCNHLNTIRLTNLGFNKYLYVYYQSYADVRKSVIEFILGFNSSSKMFMLKSEVISKVFKQPKLIINTILEDLELSGKIILRRTHGENWEINKVEHLMFENTLRKLVNIVR